MEAYPEESPAAFHDIRNMVNKCTWCVKVFVTSPDGNWEDCGTGSLGFYRRNTDTGELESANHKDSRNPSQEPNSNTPKNPLHIGVTKQNDKLGHPDSISASDQQLQKLRGGNSLDWI